MSSLIATLDEYEGAIEADFDRFYRRDLHNAIDTMDCPALFRRVKFLPPEAALWRVQADDGQSVSDGKRVKTTDPVQIADWFKNTGIS